MNICCTLVSGTYFIGAAALINSLITQGFQGEIHVGHATEIPSWWPSTGQELASGVTLVNIPIETKRALGYEKPYFLLSTAKANPHCTRLCWFDADVVVTTPWSFIQDWVDSGLAVCGDNCFSFIAPHHPWRRDWRHLIEVAGLEETNPLQDVYPNGGFLGCHIDHLSVIEYWAKLTRAFAETGGTITTFTMAERWRAVVGDQDLLAAALMCWTGPLAPIGAEAMGFNGMAFPLCHGVENPKPWQADPLKVAAQGAGLSMYRRFFEQAIRSGPLQPYEAGVLKKRQRSYKAALLITRFYSR